MNNIHRLQKLCNINKPYKDISVWYALADAYEDEAKYSMVDFIRNTSIRYLEWIRESNYKPYHNKQYYWRHKDEIYGPSYIPTEIYNLLQYEPNKGYISEQEAFYALFKAWQKYHKLDEVYYYINHT